MRKNLLEKLKNESKMSKTQKNEKNETKISKENKQFMSHNQCSRYR